MIEQRLADHAASRPDPGADGPAGGPPESEAGGAAPGVGRRMARLPPLRTDTWGAKIGVLAPEEQRPGSTDTSPDWSPLMEHRRLEDQTVGTVSIGGDLKVRRLGFGAMRASGARNAAGERVPEEAIKLYRRVYERGGH